MEMVGLLKRSATTRAEMFIVRVWGETTGQGGNGGTFLLIKLVVEVLQAEHSWRVPVERQPLAFPVFMIIEESSGG